MSFVALSLVGFSVALAAKPVAAVPRTPPALPSQCKVNPTIARKLTIFSPERPAVVRSAADVGPLHLYKLPEPCPDDTDPDSEECPNLTQHTFRPGQKVTLLGRYGDFYCVTSGTKRKSRTGWAEADELLVQGSELQTQIRKLSDLACQASVEPFKAALDELDPPMNSAGDKGQTMLMAAAGCGSTAAVSELLARGAKLAPIDQDGRTALMYAAHSTSDESGTQALEMLVKAAGAASINRRDHSGESALDHAIDAGSPARVKILLDHGASATGRNVTVYGRAARAALAAKDADPFRGIFSILLARNVPVLFRDSDGTMNVPALHRGCEILRDLKRSEGSREECAPPVVSPGKYYYCDPRDGKTESIDIPSATGTATAVVIGCPNGAVCSLPVDRLENLMQAQVDVMESDRFRWKPDDQTCGSGCSLGAILFAQKADRVGNCRGPGK